MSEIVAREIRALHEFFVDWFSASCAQEDQIFSDRLLARFHPQLILVQPGGQALAGAKLCDGLRASYGGSPDFRIAIRNVDVRMECEDHVVALYEEWQVNAKNSTPPNNGRLSTVVFKRDTHAPNALLWYHVHETWLPEPQMSAGPYDF